MGTAPSRAPRQPRLALLGTGTVGRAFVARHQRLSQRGLALPAFELLANSRGVFDCAGDPEQVLQLANDAQRNGVAHEIDAARLRRGDILVDATASDAVAARHAEWLSRGIRVVTANKLGNGADLLRAQAVARAQREGHAHYGDSATVGAGLPLLRSIRELVAGGDRIHAVEGVLSGSLAWLFDRYDGMRPFSGFVREAREAGYTEPDPRIDLSGEDVRRKLLILARAAGIALEAHEVQVDSLVPATLADAGDDELDARLPLLDAPLREHYQQAWRDGAKLRFVGRFEAGEAGCRASVGLRALPADHPLCGGSGTDNRVAIRSDRYCEQPLVVQGPGAGAEVTAAALLDDVLRAYAGG
ncbi:homoserine dehydrogenase [Luteimonas cucumeris]|uniref:homoserine dehydrogenase n=1 Tax=Luteimonas cucumeris TaxID=985012 RepID=UPI0011A77A9B|nr:homoserine dehydrogenase [Luteimonas cucumeris]